MENMMELKDLKDDLCLRKEVIELKKSTKEYIELFLEISQVTQIDLYKYDYEYDDYSYNYSVSEESEIEKLSDTQTHNILLKSNNIILGKIVSTTEIELIKPLETLIDFLNDKLLQEHNLVKKFRSDESNLSIYIISNNESREFSKQLQDDVSVLFNANVILGNSLRKIANQIESKSNKNIVIYTVNNLEHIKQDEELLKSFNDYVLVYGPNEHKISLFCGNLNIQQYVSYEDYTKENLRELILETKNMILNKFHSKNNIISVSGISGGIGCTTIAMNMANIVAKKMPHHNILFIDLSHTKAISNLFLEQNPLPEKSIVDLVNSDEFDFESNLQNGLVKIRENFHAITGIQKHIDKEFMEKDIFIEKFLNYLEVINEHYNTIIIDAGVFEASNLKTTVYDISNQIELITEMNLPHISKLKTLYSLMKRAGLKEKISFIVNRFDAKSSLSLNDVISILNITEDDKMIFNYKLSNDYLTLGKYWNQCELVSNVDEHSVFVKEITNFLMDKEIIEKRAIQKEKKGLFSFFRNQ